MDDWGLRLEACRPYLLVLAHRQLTPVLRSKVCPADLVQETFLRALANHRQFAGSGEPELLGWLRRILLNTISNTARHFHGTEKRNAGREVCLDWHAPLAAREEAGPDAVGPPVVGLIAREEEEALAEALQALPAIYRRVVHLRMWERRSFEEIGRRTRRSPEAVRKLWLRALGRLRDALSEDR